MHPLTQHIQVELSHMNQQNTGPNLQGSFLNITIFLYTATQELIGHRQGKTKLTPR